MKTSAMARLRTFLARDRFNQAVLVGVTGGAFLFLLYPLVAPISTFVMEYTLYIPIVIPLIILLLAVTISGLAAILIMSKLGVEYPAATKKDFLIWSNILSILIIMLLFVQFGMDTQNNLGMLIVGLGFIAYCLPFFLGWLWATRSVHTLDRPRSRPKLARP